MFTELCFVDELIAHLVPFFFFFFFNFLNTSLQKKNRMAIISNFDFKKFERLYGVSSARKNKNWLPSNYPSKLLSVRCNYQTLFLTMMACILLQKFCFGILKSFYLLVLLVLTKNIKNTNFLL